MIVTILLNILGPILLMVGLGAVMRRRFGLDLVTLSKLNIYLFTPAFVFNHVANSKLAWADMGGIVAITITQVATLGLLVWGIGRALRVGRKTLSAIALAVMFYNSGNYGLPLAELAYPAKATSEHKATSAASAPALAAAAPGAPHANKNGGAVQAFVVLTQNVLTFTLGLSIAAWAGSGSYSEIFTKMFRLPVLYTLTAALLARAWLDADPSHRLPVLIAKTAEYLSYGLVPVALVTLGVQLAANPRWPRWKPVTMALVLRLLIGPVQMAGLLWLFHQFRVGPLDLWPWPAELLILSAAVPTAVNTLLLTIELDGDADLAADCVFWTTVVSCVTITGWLVVIRGFIAPAA